MTMTKQGRLEARRRRLVEIVAVEEQHRILQRGVEGLERVQPGNGLGG